LGVEVKGSGEEGAERVGGCRMGGARGYVGGMDERRGGMGSEVGIGARGGEG